MRVAGANSGDNLNRGGEKDMSDQLKSLLKEQADIDHEVMNYSVKVLKPFYEKRREIVRQIPRFWAIVFSETDSWRPYITYEDSLAFDALEDVWIDWDPADSRNFTVSLTFGDNPQFEAQTLVKTLLWREKNPDNKDDDKGSDKGYYESKEPTKITLKPGVKLLEQHLNGGQESFFTWFEYTTTENTDDRLDNTTIAQFLVDDIYPAAIDLYNAAQEDEQDIAEEYDISEDDD